MSASNYHRAYAYYRKAVALSRRLGAMHAVASTTGTLGMAALETGRFEEAQQLLEESLTLGRELGYEAIVGRALRTLGILAEKCGDLPQALDYFSQSAAIHAESEDRLFHVATLLQWGKALIRAGELAQARQILRNAHAEAESSGSAYWVEEVDKVMAELRAATGEEQ
jgi:tetratricopeptide (TPR) repeat protein